MPTPQFTLPHLPVAVASFDQPVAVIGDIHGCARTLERLLAELGDIPVVFVGDLIDRGPSSKRVVELLLRRGAIGVRGNHEEWLIDWLLGSGFNDRSLSKSIGGRPTLVSFGVQGDTMDEIERQTACVPPAHAAFLTALPYVLDLSVQGQCYWVVHAGIPPNVPPDVRDSAGLVPWLAANQPHRLLWSKTKPQFVLPVDRTVIMGHAVVASPVDLGHVIAIDTGCGARRDGKLTAVLLPERRFASVVVDERDPWPA